MNHEGNNKSIQYDKTADMKHVTAGGICMQLSAESVCRHQSGVLHGCGQKRHLPPRWDENILRFRQSIFASDASRRVMKGTSQSPQQLGSVGLNQMSWNLIIYNHVCVTHFIFLLSFPVLASAACGHQILSKMSAAKVRQSFRTGVLHHHTLYCLYIIKLSLEM